MGWLSPRWFSNWGPGTAGGLRRGEVVVGGREVERERERRGVQEMRKQLDFHSFQ